MSDQFWKQNAISMLLYDTKCTANVFHTITNLTSESLVTSYTLHTILKAVIFIFLLKILLVQLQLFQSKARLKARHTSNFQLRSLVVNKDPTQYSYGPHGTQRAENVKKVHKPPLGVNVINFELNGFNASMWVPWSPLDPKKL